MADQKKISNALLHSYEARTDGAVFEKALEENEVNRKLFCDATVKLYRELKDKSLNVEQSIWLDTVEAIASRYGINEERREKEKKPYVRRGPDFRG